MKQKFSTSWNSSKQPRKQRKYIANAPLHLKRKMLSANLDKELRKKYKIRSIELRKNDEVKIMRGKHKGKKGKVSKINTKKSTVFIDGIQNTKKDGSKVNVWFHASNLKLISLDLDDRRRLENNEKLKINKEENAPKKK